MTGAGASVKVLYIGLDACDVGLMRRMVDQGRCPSIASLFDVGATVDTVAPYGTFVGSSWMTSGPCAWTTA